MDVKEEQDLETALTIWLNNHPEPDKTFITAGVHGKFSPRQLVDEITRETEAGKFFIKVIEHSAKKHGLNEIIKGFGAKN